MSSDTSAPANGQGTSTVDFSYLIDKIRDADFADYPYKHIQIKDFFEDADFQEIISSPEICVEEAADDQSLLDNLFDRSYRVIEFPGCTTDWKEYLKWHRDKKSVQKTNTACEGYGVVLRLDEPQSPVINALKEFLNSPEFVACITDKYGIDLEKCTYDAGLQKYLDGYEISPHPDIRRKALTFMVNINPSPTSSEERYHTSYLHFKPEWNYISEYWKGNDHADRFWVPWDWCDVKMEQSYNNSIVIFSPAYDTLHAVKADYNHLKYQRTQLYGNLWYTEVPEVSKPRWEDFVIKPSAGQGNLKNLIPKGMKSAIKNMVSSDKDSKHGKRNI